jgi:hypothetical protein
MAEGEQKESDSKDVVHICDVGPEQWDQNIEDNIWLLRATF